MSGIALFSKSRSSVMAKRRVRSEGINKSAEIRVILGRNPRAHVKEVVEELGKRGIAVHPNLVYLIKSKLHSRKKREKRKLAVEATRQAGFANPVALILEVRRVAEKAGGVRHLKQLVDLLAE
jgi:hypothetical protein